MSDDEAWAFIETATTGVLSSLRADGFPVALPVWFVAIDRRVYVRTPATSKKAARLRRDDRVHFLVELGEAWSELRSAGFVGSARFVEDAAVRDAVMVARRAKYGHLQEQRVHLPTATVAHYSAPGVIICVTPGEQLITWDNRKIGHRRPRVSGL
jgi:nitroimidazol reductase NimA-like FMN-containing flavoprotein (pyridoxamine 5'-phosphate oxidase superfamily)